MSTPTRTTAAAFFRYATGEVVSDSAALHWPGLHVRQFRFPRIVDTFLVPATAEPLISCVLRGSAHFQERDVGGSWITRELQRGDIFVTRSSTPYEVRCHSIAGEEIDTIAIHLAVDQFLAVLEAAYPGRTDAVEVIDFYGRDEALAHLCFACAELLSGGVSGESKSVAGLAQLLATYLVEKYTTASEAKTDLRGGLPIRQLRKVEDYVREHLAEEISIETLCIGRTESVPLLPSVQASDRNDAVAVRDTRANRTRTTAHPRDVASPHRNRA